MDRVQPVSTNVYIPKPDEVTPRNKTVQKVALLGIALGIGVGLFTAYWSFAVGVTALSAALLAFQKRIDEPRNKGEDKKTLLFKYVLDDFTRSILLFLGANPNAVSTVNKNKTTPLLDAIGPWRPNAVSDLLQAGADPNFKDNMDTTALHYAAFFREDVLCKLLIDAGADKQAISNRNEYTDIDNKTFLTDSLLGTPLEIAKRKLGMDELPDFIARRDKIIEMLEK